jgi:hypothetical protein
MEEIYLVITERRNLDGNNLNVFPCKTYNAAKRKFDSELRDSASEALDYYDIDANPMTLDEMVEILANHDSIRQYYPSNDNRMFVSVSVSCGSTNQRVHRIEITKSKVYE